MKKDCAPFVSFIYKGPKLLRVVSGSETRREGALDHGFDFVGKERRVYRGFKRLNPSDNSAISSFAMNHGSLIAPYLFPSNEDPLVTRGWREPITFWRWHLQRLQMILKLSKVLNDQILRISRPEKAGKEVLGILNEYPVSILPNLFRGRPWSPYVGHRSLGSVTAVPRDDEQVEYCPEQEGLQRPTFEMRTARSLLAYAQEVVDSTISITLATTTYTRVSTATGQIAFEPRNLLGLLYAQLLSEVCSARLPSNRICVECGKPFTAIRSDALRCGQKCRQKHSYWFRKNRPENQ